MFPRDCLQGQLSNMTPAEAPSRDGHVTENSRQPVRILSRSHFFLVNGVIQVPLNSTRQEWENKKASYAQAWVLLGSASPAPRGQRLLGPQVAPGAETQPGHLGKPRGAVPASSVQGKGRPATLIMDNIPLLRRPKAEICHEGSHGSLISPGRQGPHFSCIVGI